ncbi:MAG: DNA-protecting protein DprA [Saccharofermentans sp.]|nr:DNA-protecting protein DprA [Saccharofermentans sp.]
MDNEYITILCSEFNDSYSPLTRAQFWELYHKCGDSVEGMINSGDARVNTLLGRSGSIAFALDKLNNMGIRIVTFLDDDFPPLLRSKLKDFCPPLLYVCGDSSLLQYNYAGYVGSRSIADKDAAWTKMMVEKNISAGFGIVSGGAKGIDSISMDHALGLGGKVIAYLPDNIKTKITDKDYRRMIINKQLLLLSHVSPLAKKSKNTFVAAAMERNKFIYAQSSATAVVRSDLEKGGTWAGATEALKHKWSYVFVWDNKNYPGNQRLIELGAYPLDDNGKKAAGAATGTIADSATDNQNKTGSKQISIFDLTDQE